MSQIITLQRTDFTGRRCCLTFNTEMKSQQLTIMFFHKISNNMFSSSSQEAECTHGQSQRRAAV